MCQSSYIVNPSPYIRSFRLNSMLKNGDLSQSNFLWTVKSFLFVPLEKVILTIFSPSVLVNVRDPKMMLRKVTYSLKSGCFTSSTLLDEAADMIKGEGGSAFPMSSD